VGRGSNYDQMSLRAGNPPLREAIEFYKHAHGWSNRLIAGDSLLIMNSLLEKEGMAGHVHMIYFDPPYDIKYGSNFQRFDVTQVRLDEWLFGISA
jgi:DNA modification methylase